MKKFGVLLAAIALFTTILTHEAKAQITSSITNIPGNALTCAQSKVGWAVSSMVNSVQGFTNGISDSINDIQDIPNTIVSDIGTSFNSVRSATNGLVSNTIGAINQNISGLRNSLNGNISAVQSMVTALENGTDFSGYVYQNGQRSLRTITNSNLAREINNVVDLIPTAGQMNSNQNTLNQQRLSTNQAALSAMPNATRAISDINKLGSLSRKLGLGNGFSVSDLTDGIDEVAYLNNIMNQPMPQSLSQAVNLASHALELQNFAVAGIEQVEFVQSIIGLITNIQALQGLQDGAFTAMELATNISNAISSIQTVIGLISGDYNVRDFEAAVRQGARAYRNIKANIGDIRAAVAAFQQVAQQMQQLRQEFEQNVTQISGIFNQEQDILTFMGRIGALPDMGPIIAQFEDYLNIAKRATDYQNAILGFGADAAATETVLAGVAALAPAADTKVQQISNDLRNSNPINQQAANADIATANTETARAEAEFNGLSQNSSSFESTKTSVRSRVATLRGNYQTGTQAYNSLVSIANKLDNLPTGNQISTFALDGLGITGTTRTVIGAYRQISTFSSNNITGPLDNFSNQLGSIGNMQGVMNTYTNAVGQLANARNIVDSISGSIQSLGGLADCFNIDVERVIREVLIRVKDKLVEKVKNKIWDFMGTATNQIPFLMLPRDRAPRFDNPFRGAENEYKPWQLEHMIDSITPEVAQNTDEWSLYELASVSKVSDEDLHPLAGMQFAQATLAPSRTRGHYTLGNTGATTNMSDFDNNLRYRDTMSSWNYRVAVVPTVDFGLANWSLTIDNGDFRATTYSPFQFRCGGAIRKQMCWYWSWVNYLFFRVKVPYFLPACETRFDYKEPTVHVEISPRAATSHVANLSILKEIPSGLGNWTSGGEDPVPSAHIFGISPEARYLSNLNPIFASHTMVCDLAEKWVDDDGTFEYIQLYNYPIPAIKLVKETPFSLQHLSDWNEEWFDGKSPLFGAFPAALSVLYASEMDRTHWNPRVSLLGETPTGETWPPFDASRTEAYKYVLPYTSGVSPTTSELRIGNLRNKDGRNYLMNKCDANVPSDGSNVCIGDWGGLFPRNGQVTNDGSVLPLREELQLAWRAYDRLLEGDREDEDDLTSARTVKINPLKIARGTAAFGVGYRNTEFSMDWPYESRRYPVGENPRSWIKGYYGDKPTSGGMLMTLWRDTSCCVKVCCDYPGVNIHPGETWYFPSALRFFERDRWKITEVTNHNPNSANSSLTETLPENNFDNTTGNIVDYDGYVDINALNQTVVSQVYSQCIATQPERQCMKSVYNIQTNADCIGSDGNFSYSRCSTEFPTYSSTSACMAVWNDYQECSDLGYPYSNSAACTADGNSAIQCTVWGL